MLYESSPAGKIDLHSLATGRSLAERSWFKPIEQSYGADVLNMVVARGYIARLLANDAVVKFLQTNYPHFLTEFRAIAAAGSLEESVAA